MKFIKTTALLTLLVSFIMMSCEKEAEVKKTKVFSKNGIILSGAQVVPASTTSATGTMNVIYDKRTSTLNYTVTWSGLTGNPTGIGIYGLAPKGYAVLPTAPTQVISTTGLTASGSLSGSLLFDGVYLKEEDLLNGMYYFMIRTAANGGAGELRAQIVFQQIVSK